MAQILVVEDEAGISSFVAKGLRAAGHQPTIVETGADALTHALTNGYDLIILDIGLPDMDGFEVLDQARGSGLKTPVIILTARSSVDDTVAGLEGGADDYMAKPFRFEELLARVRLRLRGGQTSSDAEPGVLRVGDLALDLKAHTVTVGGQPVELATREFAMLEASMRHPDQVLSREQLLSRVWGYDFDPESNVVDVYVGYLRKKIGASRIATVWRVGYKLTTQG